MSCGCKGKKTTEQPQVPQITKKQQVVPPVPAPPKIVRENNNNNIVQTSNETLIDKILNKIEDINQSH